MLLCCCCLLLCLMCCCCACCRCCCRSCVCGRCYVCYPTNTIFAEQDLLFQRRMRVRQYPRLYTPHGSISLAAIVPTPEDAPLRPDQAVCCIHTCFLLCLFVTCFSLSGLCAHTLCWQVLQLGRVLQLELREPPQPVPLGDRVRREAQLPPLPTHWTKAVRCVAAPFVCSLCRCGYFLFVCDCIVMRSAARLRLLLRRSSLLSAATDTSTHLHTNIRSRLRSQLCSRRYCGHRSGSQRAVADSCGGTDSTATDAWHTWTSRCCASGMMRDKNRTYYQSAYRAIIARKPADKSPPIVLKPCGVPEIGCDCTIRALDPVAAAADAAAAAAAPMTPASMPVSFMDAAGCIPRSRYARVYGCGAHYKRRRVFDRGHRRTADTCPLGRCGCGRGCGWYRCIAKNRIRAEAWYYDGRYGCCSRRRCRRNNHRCGL